MSNKSSQLFLVVAGNIGSGKTTLTKKLAQRLEIKPFFESVEDNPYLSDFYKDMKRWSFPLQIYFLTHRFKVHKDIQSNSYSAVQDRSIYEDANIFARALFEQGDLSKRDYENYLSLFSSMTEHLRFPSLTIFLKRSVDKLFERINMRGRDYEMNIPREYISRLNGYYEDWFKNYKGKYLLVDTDELDFMNNEQEFERLVKKVLESIDQKDLFFTY